MMSNFMFKLIIFMFLFGVLCFCMNHKFMLVSLLILEFLVLSLYSYLYLYMNYFISEFFFLMLFLIMVVCEGVLGLCILISMIRSYGIDYFKVYSLI